MSGDIVNLKRFRKTKAKQAAEGNAAANRQKFGRAKAEKQLQKLTSEQLAKKLDQHQMAPDQPKKPDL